MKDVPLYFGLSLDLTLHPRGGRSNLATTKRQLVDLLTSLVEVSCYLYQGQYNLEVFDKGRSGSEISNYKMLSGFNCEYAFKQTIYVTDSIDIDAHKYIFVITDNFQKEDIFQYKKCFIIAEKDDVDAKIFVIGVGNSCHPSIQNVIEGFSNAFFLTCEADELKDNIMKILEKDHG